MTMLNLTRVRHIVGGETLLHRPSLIAAIPPFLLASLMSRSIASVRDGLFWTLANIAAFGVCWVLIETADRTVCREKHARPVAFVVVVVLGVVVGAAKGTFTDLFGVAFGVGVWDVTSVVWRSVGTAIVGAVSLPALSVARFVVLRYRAEHELLVAQHLHNVAEQADVSPETLSLFVTDARNALRDVPPSTAAETIITLIDTRLRPYTHELWDASQAAPKRLTVRDVLLVTLRDNPLPIGVLSVVYGVSVWPVSGEFAGVAQGTLRALIAGVTFAATLWLFSRVRPQTMRAGAGALYLAMTVFVATVIQMLQYNYLFGGLADPATAGLWVSVFSWILTLMLVGGAAMTALKAPAALREAVLTAVGPEALKAFATKDYDRLFAQKIATRLHADMQGVMLSAARRIAAHEHDPDVVAAELARLDQALATLTCDTPGESPVVLRDQLDQLVSRWDGFVAVKLDTIDDVAPTNRVLRDQIVQVVSEGIVNAIRHGFAAHITVTVEGAPNCATVTVVDDGIGPRAGSKGLGATFFASVSGGNWSLLPQTDGGSVLTVHVTG